MRRFFASMAAALAVAGLTLAPATASANDNDDGLRLGRAFLSSLSSHGCMSADNTIKAIEGVLGNSQFSMNALNIGFTFLSQNAGQLCSSSRQGVGNAKSANDTAYSLYSHSNHNSNNHDYWRNWPGRNPPGGGGGTCYKTPDCPCN